LEERLEEMDVSMRQMELRSENALFWKRKTRQRWMDEDEVVDWVRTHDCADDLAPLALPPDLPPVIFADLDEFGVLW
jgi:hypothetical protein